jgi:molybdate transport repressor ModE-like protein
MGMSYKRAWVLLDRINRAFTQPVVTAAPGGAGDGDSSQTPFEKLTESGKLQEFSRRHAQYLPRTT